MKCAECKHWQDLRAAGFRNSYEGICAYNRTQQPPWWKANVQACNHDFGCILFEQKEGE